MINKIINYINTKGSIKAKYNGIYFNTFKMISHIKKLGINPVTFIDVGANRGMLSKTVNYLFPECKIYCFEPIQSCFNELLNLEKTTSNLKVFNCAISDFIGEAEFNESEYDYSSSLLKMAEKHKIAFPQTKSISTYKVNVYKLDYFNNQMKLNPPVMLKLDVQGAELNVIRGADRILEKVDFILCELSISELYINQPLVSDIIIKLKEKGFYLFDIIELNRDPKNSELLQFDALFKKL